MRPSPKLSLAMLHSATSSIWGSPQCPLQPGNFFPSSVIISDKGWPPWVKWEPSGKLHWCHNFAASLVRKVPCSLQSLRAEQTPNPQILNNQWTEAGTSPQEEPPREMLDVPDACRMGLCGGWWFRNAADTHAQIWWHRKLASAPLPLLQKNY